MDEGAAAHPLKGIAALTDSHIASRRITLCTLEDPPSYCWELVTGAYMSSI